MLVKVILDPKTSRRIFELARDQQEEFEMPDDETEIENTAFAVPRPQILDDEDDDNMEADADEDRYVDEVVVSVIVSMILTNARIVVWSGN
jgi:essential nuclear protein 1